MTVYDLSIPEKNAFAAEIESKAKDRAQYLRLLGEFLRGLWTVEEIREALK